MNERELRTEIDRLERLVQDGLDNWCYGGASSEEEKALRQLANLAHRLVSERES